MKRAALLVVLVLAAMLPAAAAAPPVGKVARLELQVSALEAKVGRLQAEIRLLADSGARSLRREEALKRRLAAFDPCDVTQPNGSRPPGSTFGAEFHGNGALWVGLPTSNVVVGLADAHSAISEKLGWWREVPGALRIEGRRLDAPAPPLTASVPDGYGGTGFQASGIVFPTAGCWEVTGRVGDASLTFVTLVLGA